MGIIGRDPSVSKSNRLLHVDIFQVFFIALTYISLHSSKKLMGNFPGVFTLTLDVFFQAQPVHM